MRSGAGRVAIWSRLAGRCPSGQREQTVNLPAQPTKVRILPGPPSPSLTRSPQRLRWGRSRAQASAAVRRCTCPGRGCSLQCGYECVRLVSSLPGGRGAAAGAGTRHRIRATSGRGSTRWVYIGRTAASVRGFDPSAIPVVGPGPRPLDDVGRGRAPAVALQRAGRSRPRARRRRRRRVATARPARHPRVHRRHRHHARGRSPRARPSC